MKKLLKKVSVKSYNIHVPIEKVLQLTDEKNEKSASHKCNWGRHFVTLDESRKNKQKSYFVEFVRQEISLINDLKDLTQITARGGVEYNDMATLRLECKKTLSLLVVKTTRVMVETPTIKGMNLSVEVTRFG